MGKKKGNKRTKEINKSPMKHVDRQKSKEVTSKKNKVRIIGTDEYVDIDQIASYKPSEETIKSSVFSRRYDTVTDYYVDGHAHFYDWSDGQMKFGYGLKLARDNNVAVLGCTVHNNAELLVKITKDYGLQPFKAYHDINGIRVMLDIEATVRDSGVLNYKGNPVKEHMLVIGPSLTEKSPIVQLMKIKAENDKLVDYGLLYYVRDMLNLRFDYQTVKDYVIERRKENPGFNSFTKEDVVRFYGNMGVDIAKSQRELEEILGKVPQVPRLNIELSDLIKVAHASGAMVIFAHPGTTLVRTPNKDEAIRHFLELGGDGFEMIYNGMNEETYEAILKGLENFRSPNSILFTAGSDTHIPSEDVTIGRCAKGWMPIKSAAGFLEEMDRLQNAREKGVLTHRVYENVSSEEIRAIIEKYKVEQQESVRDYQERLEKMGVVARNTEAAVKKFHSRLGTSKRLNPIDFDFESYLNTSLIVKEEELVKDKPISDTIEDSEKVEFSETTDVSEVVSSILDDDGADPID